MEEPIDIVYAEVFEILKNIEKEKVMKIPKHILKEINSKRNREINVKYDWNKPLVEQRFFSDTINIIAYFNNTFWIDKQTIKKQNDISNTFNSTQNANMISIENTKLEHYEKKNIFKKILSFFRKK